MITGDQPNQREVRCGLRLNKNKRTRDIHSAIYLHPCGWISSFVNKTRFLSRSLYYFSRYLIVFEHVFMCLQSRQSLYQFYQVSIHNPHVARYYYVKVVV